MMTPQQETTFYVMCIRSHVCEALPGTKLYEFCSQQLRENPEYVSAPIISSDDCLGCWFERSTERSEYIHNYWDWEYCVEHNDHGSKCPTDCRSHVTWPEEISEGRYAGQMKWLREDD
jgi:hypothetical protein